MYYTHEKFDTLEAASLIYQRGSCIPYAIVNGVKYFLLGIDKKYNEITHLGGTRQWNDRDIIDTAVREYREETLDVLNNTKRTIMGAYVTNISVSLPGSEAPSERESPIKDADLKPARKKKTTTISECTLFLLYNYTTMSELYDITDSHRRKVAELEEKNTHIEVSALVWIDEEAMCAAFEIKNDVIIRFSDGEEFYVWTKLLHKFRGFKKKIISHL